MKIKKHIKTIISICIVLAVYFTVIALIGSGSLSRHYQSLLVPIGINVILAVSLNLTVGFLGELTLGHAGFMSVGAYAGCMFSVYCDLPAAVEFPLALLIGGVTAAIFGVIIGIPALRLKGDYLAIVTLAFGEIIRSIVTNLDFLGGAGGLKGITKYKDTSTGFTTVFIVLVITVVVIRNLVNSRHGRAICSIRDNVIASESVGINVVFYKLLAFVMAAFFACCGSSVRSQSGILKPSTFDFNKSIEILVIVVLGGMGSITGSIISAIIITLLPEVLRGLDDYRLLIYAVVLIAMMLLNNNPKFNALKESVKGKIRPGKKGKAVTEKEAE